MKKALIITALAMSFLTAKHITISQQDIKAWQIQTEKVPFVKEVPLGSFLLSVTTPPELKRTISLPFEAQVTRLRVALYQNVRKGDLLAEVTGTEWIEAQQKAIADAIELRHHTHAYERKKRLCREEIIPKKECIAALAELKTDRIKVAASKALLQSYGAGEETISALFKNFKIDRTIKVVAPDNGVIVSMQASPGKSSDPAVALFVIQKPGALWIEGNLPLKKTRQLQIGEAVKVKVEGTVHDGKVLQIAPVINPQNQTQPVRFGLSKSAQLLPGMRSNGVVILLKEAVKVPKKSVVKHDGIYLLFVKKGEHFEDVHVKIIGEEPDYYYLQPDEALRNPVVTTSVSVLKNLAGDGAADE